MVGPLRRHIRALPPGVHAFPAAVESDAALAEDSLKTYRRLAHIRSSVSTDAPDSRLDEMLFLLEAALPRALHDLTILSSVAPAAYRPDGVLSAYTDVVHRALFGVIDEVNVHEGRGRRLPRISLGPVMTEAFADQSGGNGGPPARRPGRGAHRVRRTRLPRHARRRHRRCRGRVARRVVRYFTNKDEVALRLAADAMQTISKTLAKIPDAPAALEQWLREYNRVQASESAILRV